MEARQLISILTLNRAMTFNFLGPGLTVNVEAKVKEQIILDSSVFKQKFHFLIRLLKAIRRITDQDSFKGTGLK